MTERVSPYLSVVTTCRNDDHGGSPITRLQAFVESFNDQCRQTGLSAELIVVDWNPPGDRAPLADAITWPSPLAYDARFIQVPPELHQTLRFSDKLPLFQMIAKNVGIRRATGRFVLSTNIDILFADELIEFIAAGKLESGHLYRVNRHDIENDFPVGAPHAELMDYCRTHHLRVHHKWGSYAAEPDGTMRPISRDIVQSPEIRLTRWWHAPESGSLVPRFRWVGTKAEFAVRDLASAGHILELEVQSHPGSPDSHVELALVGPDSQRVGTATVTGFQRISFELPSEGLYTLEVLDAPELRHLLPYYECRDNMLYRINGMRLRRPRPAVPPVAETRPGENDGSVAFPLGLFQPSWPPVTVQREATGVLLITTAPDPGSYAVEWQGIAPATGTYRFRVEFDALEGNGSFGVLSGSRTRWLASADPVDVDGTARVVELEVELVEHETFWLALSNFRQVSERSTLRLNRVLVYGPNAELMVPAENRGWLGRLRDWRQRYMAGVYDRLALRLPPAVRNSVINRSEILLRLERRLNDMTDSRSRFEQLTLEFEPLVPHAEFLKRNRPVCLHLNACGDFQLMAREHWFELLGFAEVQTYSMNVDGLFCFAAHYGGIKEHVFEEPLCIYHIEHETGSGYTPEGEQILRKRMDDRGIPWVEWPVVATWASYMQWLDQPLALSGADWGFANEQLPEQVIPATAASSR
jgi:hypothetical protein